MIMETHYYLLNNTVKKGGEMPVEPKHKKDLGYEHYLYDMNDWEESLQPCEISESEFDKVTTYVFNDYNRKESSFSNPIDVTDIVEDNNGVITFKQPKQVESEYDTEHKLFLESGKEYLLENFDILSCDVETHQIALIAIRKALKQTKNIYSIDDQHGAFAQMYKKAQNMDIFDFITMFSEKYEIFKNR